MSGLGVISSSPGQITNTLQWVGWEFAPWPASPPDGAAYIDATRLSFHNFAIYTTQSGSRLSPNLVKVSQPAMSPSLFGV